MQMASDPKNGIAPQGFEWKEIPFVIVINHNGSFIALEDTRKGEMKRAESYLLPKSIGRSGSKSWMTSNFLWDHYGYVLGISTGEDAKNTERAKSQLSSFFDKIKSLPESLKMDDGISAVLSFYERKEYKKVISDRNWQECIKIKGCNMSFRLVDESNIISYRPKIRSYIEKECFVDCNESDSGICLLTGKYEPISRVHSDTPINKDSKKIVSFQKNSGYDSYGKEQAYNAPTSKIAEFAYTTALNKLLSRNSKNKVRIGDMTMVFWAEGKSILEELYSALFSFPDQNDPDADVRALATLSNNISYKNTEGLDRRFYVLCLKPNVARISVRFWCESTEKDISESIRKHYQDIDVVRSEYDTAHYSVYWYLSSMAPENRIENISSNMASCILRSIITGEKYPVMMLHQTILRIRSMRNVRRMQAGILKAYLNRSCRVYSSDEKEMISVSLDENNMSTAYQLGRIFAVFEEIQKKSIPGANSTIRDSYYAVASSTPSKVFPKLFKMKNYHIGMIKVKGLRVKYEKLLTEIIDRITADIPSSLVIEDQARFAIGYYHQKSDLKKLSNSK